MTNLSARAQRTLASSTSHNLWPTSRAAAQTSLLAFDRSYLASFLRETITSSTLDPTDLLVYSPTEGGAELRETISSNSSIDAGNILITEGASEGLALLFAASLDAGDRILIPSPGLPAYDQVASMFGATVVRYTVRTDPVATIEQIASHLVLGNVKLVVIGTPHNPTGYCLSEPQIAQIVRLSSDAGTFVVIDDAYRWMMRRSDRMAPDAAALFELTERIAVVCSIGKFLCLPGLRLGAVVAPSRKLISASVEMRRHLTHSSSPLLERLATRLINDAAHEHAKQRLNDALRRRRSLLEELLASVNAEPYLGGQGFYVYADKGETLDHAGICGISGATFGGAASARRYCLASSFESWKRLQDWQVSARLAPSLV